MGILKRLSVYAANSSVGGKKHMMAFGGLVPKGSDSDLTRELARLVESQCGLPVSKVKKWYKLLEVVYSDLPPTVFFLPSLSDIDGELVLMPQEQETTKEVTEIVEQGQDGEKSVRSVEKVSKAQTLRPQRCIFSQMLEFSANDKTHQRRSNRAGGRN